MRKDKKTGLPALLLAHTSSEGWQLTPLPFKASGKPGEGVWGVQRFLVLGGAYGGRFEAAWAQGEPQGTVLLTVWSGPPTAAAPGMPSF